MEQTAGIPGDAVKARPGLSGRIFVRRDATYNPVPMFALRAYRP